MNHSCARHLALGAVAIGLMVLGGCTRLSEYDARQMDRVMLDSLTSTTESWDPVLTLMEEGRILLRIQGRHATSWRLASRKETSIEGPVTVELFDTTGAVTSIAHAMRAVYRPEREEFILMDSVRVESGGDHFLWTDHLYWSGSDDRISSNQMVTIVTPTDSLTGTEFTSTIDLTQYTILSPRGRSEVE